MLTSLGHTEEASEADIFMQARRAELILMAGAYQRPTRVTTLTSLSSFRARPLESPTANDAALDSPVWEDVAPGSFEPALVASLADAQEEGPAPPGAEASASQGGGIAASIQEGVQEADSWESSAHVEIASTSGVADRDGQAGAAAAAALDMKGIENGRDSAHEPAPLPDQSGRSETRTGGDRLADPDSGEDGKQEHGHPTRLPELAERKLGGGDDGKQKSGEDGPGIPSYVRDIAPMDPPTSWEERSEDDIPAARVLPPDHGSSQAALCSRTYVNGSASLATAMQGEHSEAEVAAGNSMRLGLVPEDACSLADLLADFVRQLGMQDHIRISAPHLAGILGQSNPLPNGLAAYDENQGNSTRNRSNRQNNASGKAITVEGRLASSVIVCMRAERAAD